MLYEVDNADIYDELNKIKQENEWIRAENKELVDALSASEAKAHTRLNRITFLTSKLEELEDVNRKRKAERDEAKHEIDRLRTVIGGLTAIIDDLNDSKSEISDLFSSLRTALQTDDILEGVNKLKKENECLKDELKSSWIGHCKNCKQNEEAKRLLDEATKLNLKLHDANEKIRKLEEDNGKLTQKISCADKLLSEAANRLYQGRAHLSISAH